MFVFMFVLNVLRDVFNDVRSISSIDDSLLADDRLAGADWGRIYRVFWG